jgi:hypothetical protein
LRYSEELPSLLPWSVIILTATAGRDLEEHSEARL